ncbi:MAG: Ku protein [Gemmatimonadetes bacterium]|nr:MAG: Ku protein [Gemmatimonadota bacterium]
MSARPIAASTISFGLVSLPVKLYSTGEASSKIRFNWLDRETGTRVKQQYVNPVTGDVVAREDMVKGYEFAKGQYVLFTDEELKAIEQPKTDSIEITEFIPEDQVDRIYLDRAYFLGPDKGGARAYRLLSAALRDTGRVAIAKYATRGKQYLVMVRPYEDGLLLEQLKYAHEVRSFADVPREEGEVVDAELQLAKQLVEQAASTEFHPEHYTDEVRERMLELIQAKIDGEEITAAHAEEPQTKIIDLMEALKASLEGEEEARKPARKAASKTKTKARRKASSG